MVSQYPRRMVPSPDDIHGGRGDNVKRLEAFRVRQPQVTILSPRQNLPSGTWLATWKTDTSGGCGGALWTVSHADLGPFVDELEEAFRGR